MRFKRRPNEIKPPPRSLVARGAGRLIRDFSSVAWYPCLDGKTVGQLSAGTTAARTISPAPRGGSKMTAPLPPRCYAAGFRGASESLSLLVASACEETRTGWPWKNCPPSSLPGLLMYPGMKQGLETERFPSRDFVVVTRYGISR